MRTILGLGNPGPEYAETRHNAGWWLADHLAARWGLGAWRRERFYRIVIGEREGRTVRLVKPLTYMNRSGAVLAPLHASGEFDPATELLVLVDEAALPVGRFRLRAMGSAGGHNGLKSIEAALGGREYARLRIGVGPMPETGDDLADYVLDIMPSDERTAVTQLLDPMSEAVECWLAEGIEPAMNRFNRRENP
ncbi:MAG TPA: aminoacyl-tRNA hydrolase [Gemmatimonadales bacterium]